LHDGDAGELIGGVASNIVEEHAEDFRVLRTSESRCPLYVAHSLLGHAPRVQKNEVV
jgi:hypothetical protein